MDSGFPIDFTMISDIRDQLTNEMAIRIDYKKTALPCDKTVLRLIKGCYINLRVSE